MKIIFYNLTLHFKNNLRNNLGPFVQYPAIFLCHIFCSLAFKMANILSGTIVSFFKKV